MLRLRTASLAFRVTAFVGLATTLVFLAFGLIVVRSLHHHFAEQDAGELTVVAGSIQNVLSTHTARNGDRRELALRLSGAVAGHHGVYFYVADAQRQVVFKSEEFDLTRVVQTQPPVSHIGVETLQDTIFEGKAYRTVVLQMPGPTEDASRTYTVAVAGNMDAHLHYIERFQETLWLTTVLVGVIALFSAWLAVRQGHAPIRKISAKIRGITSSQLHVRLRPQDVPIELADLVNSFNDMLGQLEDGFQRLENFSADIAHELRTPVTNLTTETQVALGKDRSVEEYREILYSNLEEFERMSKMIGNMLFLAQTDNDLSHMEPSVVDLAQETRGLFDYFEAWAEERGVALELVGRADSVTGDHLMLRRALGNLLSNAIRYTPRGHAVTVRFTQSGETVTVAVENPGPTIANEHLPRLFDRFYRVDTSRRKTDEGAGLGLAIVKSIVDLHHGKVSVTSQADVTRFEVVLLKQAPVIPI